MLTIGTDINRRGSEGSLDYQNLIRQLVDIDEIQFGLVSYQDVQLQTTLLFW